MGLEVQCISCLSYPITITHFKWAPGRCQKAETRLALEAEAGLEST